jgi:hypothetical protein
LNIFFHPLLYHPAFSYQCTAETTEKTSPKRVIVEGSTYG